MNQIRYCTNHPATITEATHLCPRCQSDLERWLDAIPRYYASLDATPGSVEPDPDKRAPKRTTIAAPMRLDVLDLLDTRLGRKWLGTEATEDRRGVTGTLLAICREIIDGRNLTIPPKITVDDTARFVRRHLEWLVTQEWVGDTYAELKTLYRSLANACGEYRAKPVGRCVVGPEGDICGGGLFPTRSGGVNCANCGDHWASDELRRLGLLLNEQRRAEAEGLGTAEAIGAELGIDPRRIRVWGSRGQIAKRGTDSDGVTLYGIDDVKARLERDGEDVA